MGLRDNQVLIVRAASPSGECRHTPKRMTVDGVRLREMDLIVALDAGEKTGIYLKIKRKLKAVKFAPGDVVSVTDGTYKQTRWQCMTRSKWVMIKDDAADAAEKEHIRSLADLGHGDGSRWEEI